MSAARGAIALLALALLLTVALGLGGGARRQAGGIRLRAAAAVGSDPLMRLRPAPAPPARPRGGHRRPAVIVQPHSVTVAPGRLAGFTAAASGAPAPRTQWQRSLNGGRTWTDVAGAHRVSITFKASRAQNGSEYRAVFTNAAGRATTRAARLMVRHGSGATGGSGSGGGGGSTGAGGSGGSGSSSGTGGSGGFSGSGGSGPSGGSGALSAPQIVTQPADQSVESGATARFATVASGVVSGVQWQVSTDAGADWSDVPYATTMSYSFLAAPTENGYEYRAVLSNQGGSTTTRAATLTVTAAPGNTAPQVTNQPTNQTIPEGDYTTFTAAASGTPTPSVQWEVSTDGGQNWSPIVGANSTTYGLNPGFAQNGNEYRAVFANLAGSATTDAATLVVVSQSGNWSGYGAVGTTFSAVTGSWNVPSVTCTGGATTYSSQWIGIDGFSDNTVEQDGTESDCLNGIPNYDAWYEMYGDNNVNSGYEVELAPSSTYPVTPGDAMTASVSLEGSTWTLAISDATAGWTFSTSIPSPSPAPEQSSAEWIVERPEVGGGFSSLADFGSAAFTGATATDNSASGPISSFSNEPLQMVGSSSSDILATPGPLASGGTGFTVTWNGST